MGTPAFCALVKKLNIFNKNCLFRTFLAIICLYLQLFYQLFIGLILGGDYTRWGYVQYVPVIQADVLLLTTFIDILSTCRLEAEQIEHTKVHARTSIAIAEQTIYRQSPLFSSVTKTSF